MLNKEKEKERALSAQGKSAQTYSMPQSAAAEKEKPISFYDKTRKTLLLKRRDEERQLKLMKKSHTWKMLVSMSQQLENAMNIGEAEKRRKLQQQQQPQLSFSTSPFKT